VDSVEEMLNNAETVLSSERRDPVKLDKIEGHIATIRAYIADLRGDPEDCKAYAYQALEKLTEEDRLTIAYAWMMLATGFNRTGKISKGEQAIQEGLAACKPYPYSYIMIGLLCMQSRIPYLRGQLDQSAAILQKALELCDERNASGFPPLPLTGFVHIYLSSILYQWNQLDKAREEIDRGLEMLESWGDTDAIIVGLITAAKIYSSLENNEDALHTLKKARKFSKDIPFWQGRIVAFENVLHAKKQDMARVIPWLSKHESLFEKEFGLENEFIYRCMVKILLYQERFEDADLFLTKMLPLVEASELTDQQIRVLVLKAAALSGLRKPQAALDTLRTALDRAKTGGYIRVFIQESHLLVPLLYQAMHQGIHPAYCQRLLDEAGKWQGTDFHSTKVPGTTAEENLVETLSEREIEVLGYIAQGLTNQEIAQELILSLYTVKSHARNIYSKLEVKNRTEAVAKARLFGLLPQD
jgi:LuxR family maltose regulon positive regulatory protein